MITKTIMTLGIMAGFVIGISFSSVYAGIPWDTADIADDAITSEKIGKKEVKTSDIRNNAVKSSKIRDGTITSTDIADGTIKGVDIADGTIFKSDLHPTFFTTQLFERTNFGGGGQTLVTTMSPVATSICFLSTFGVENTDTDSEFVQCSIQESFGKWSLRAFLENPTDDAKIRCSARCFNWQ